MKRLLGFFEQAAKAAERAGIPLRECRISGKGISEEEKSQLFPDFASVSLDKVLDFYVFSEIPFHRAIEDKNQALVRLLADASRQLRADLSARTRGFDRLKTLLKEAEKARKLGDRERANALVSEYLDSLES